MVLLDELLLGTLSHTAEDTDDDTSALLATNRVIVSDAVEDFLLGIVAHGAGIEEDRISQLGVFGQVEAVHLHDRSHDFAVGYVHLTAISLYVDTARRGGRRLLKRSLLGRSHTDRRLFK